MDNDIAKHCKPTPVFRLEIERRATYRGFKSLPFRHL